MERLVDLEKHPKDNLKLMQCLTTLMQVYLTEDEVAEQMGIKQPRLTID